MARTPTLPTSTKAAVAAAQVADGHVAPIGPTVSATGDTLGDVRQAEKAFMAAEPPGTVGAAAAHDMRLGVDPGFIIDPYGSAGALAASGRIVIVCTKPGFYRAGMSHPLRAEYDLDYFTEEQLDQLFAEPCLVCSVVGDGYITPRIGRPHGAAHVRTPSPDPLLAGMAAEAAISGGTTRATPGLRAAMVNGGWRARLAPTAVASGVSLA